METAEKQALAIHGGPFNVYYGRKQVLYDISLSIEKNKITSIIGQSGCGKSTLLKSLNRIIEEENGKIDGNIHLFGKNILTMHKENCARQSEWFFRSRLFFRSALKKI